MDVSRTIFSSHGNGMQNLSEEQLLLTISTCCVRKQTLQARVGELYKTKEDSGQTVESFLAALKMKARQCDMKVQCTKSECEEMIDYSTEIIKKTLYHGTGRC